MKSVFKCLCCRFAPLSLIDTSFLSSDLQLIWLDKYRYKYTDKSLSNYRYKYQTLKLPSFICSGTGKISFCVFLFVIAVKDLLHSYSLFLVSTGPGPGCSWSWLIETREKRMIVQRQNTLFHPASCKLELQCCVVCIIFKIKQ